MFPSNPKVDKTNVKIMFLDAAVHNIRGTIIEENVIDFSFFVPYGTVWRGINVFCGLN